MNLTRRWKPFWRWEAFLFAMVLVLAIAASFVTRADWPVVGPILGIVLLVLAVVIAVLLLLPLFHRNGRDSENTRKSLEGVELLEVEPEKTLRVVESDRRQNAIDAARAKTTGPLSAVLTPDASRWLGRELRVAVDLIAGDGQIYRAGFVPREVDIELGTELRALAARRAAIVVPVTITGSGRPFTVDFGLGPIPA
ncbi:hypothetical protein [Herbiconiux ginsengi]|uniref:Uncharacterized protein n=1 Tax=Herbiconiux ginsengi TaxID=381665 RepID=A0A1H3PJ04_9MICO|nr:hypothetical protein [Herbiconiux ginsengi]SDZ01106.1 hypothetical protein SAMN05216554_1920 [Herbiconiux ginsengi]